MKMTSFEQALNLRICDLYLIMSLKIHLNKTFLLDVKYVFLSPVSVTKQILHTLCMYIIPFMNIR